VGRGDTIETLLGEERRYPPPPEFAAQANANANIYERDFEEFWETEAHEHVSWIEPFTKLLEWELPYAKWYLGGQAERLVALWNRELLEELLPIQDEPNVPVVLACDDVTLRAVGERLGYEATEAARVFAQDVKVAFSVGRLTGFKHAVRGPFEELPRPRPLPQSFALLCLWVLAASRMGADEKYPTAEYYGRLNGLLEIAGDDQLLNFEFIHTDRI